MIGISLSGGHTNHKIWLINNLSIVFIMKFPFNAKRTAKYHTQTKIDHRIVDRSVQWVERFIRWFCSAECNLRIRSWLWNRKRKTVSGKWLACPYKHCSHFRPNWFVGIEKVKNRHFEWNKKRWISLPHGKFETSMHTGRFQNSDFLLFNAVPLAKLGFLPI